MLLCKRKLVALVLVGAMLANVGCQNTTSIVANLANEPQYVVVDAYQYVMTQLPQDLLEGNTRSTPVQDFAQVVYKSHYEKNGQIVNIDPNNPIKLADRFNKMSSYEKTELLRAARTLSHASAESTAETKVPEESADVYTKIVHKMEDAIDQEQKTDLSTALANCGPCQAYLPTTLTTGADGYSDNLGGGGSSSGGGGDWNPLPRFVVFNYGGGGFGGTGGGGAGGGGFGGNVGLSTGGGSSGGGDGSGGGTFSNPYPGESIPSGPGGPGSTPGTSVTPTPNSPVPTPGQPVSEPAAISPLFAVFLLLALGTYLAKNGRTK